ncbi:allophanate hydrolase subunit 1 [Pseudomaricurvus alkylphenolicus]|jgi:KipI family sensor histidine kinase inhibitor|uniref:5-oxoprolinase subunit B family protein n=1 Tax=Pseudomaricurvus alkylphenolicus TaxID=1306991 RepID=UPI00141EAFD5|nr:allophanate hydrolase subunit 1 [Pseudomaricurvus alkylphenolicus]NIB44171.1 allophanate hydrolase subunit 1 [Pseudomaricurvus alkylphenolicus]
MIFEEPRFSPGGDRYLLIEFGDEMNLELNFLGQALAAAIEEQQPAGIIETAPCFASTLVHYEPEILGYADAVALLSELLASLGPSADIELNSRLFYIPAVYLDPWTRECVQDYTAKINADKQPDPDYVAELNGLNDAAHLARVHSGTEYWVASLGFWPGLPFMMPLDPRCKLTAPKYNPPRTWTPKGAIGMGGASTAIYPEQLPGGYQIFARTPVPIWDADKRFPVFENSICLFQPGDRVKFVPCSVDEFEHYEAQVAAGTYVYNLVEYQKFSVKHYQAWVQSLDFDQTF